MKNLSATLADQSYRLILFLLVTLSFPAHGSQCSCCERDANGKIKRSAASRNEFKQTNPCPSNGLRRGPCPGYVIDHIVALKRCGLDAPSNMQWQAVYDAKMKDRRE